MVYNSNLPCYCSDTKGESCSKSRGDKENELWLSSVGRGMRVIDKLDNQ